MANFDPAFTRAELIEVLSTMGVSIPETSKLPKDALEKRLGHAINSSQSLSSIISRPPISLSQYSKWAARPEDSRSVKDAIRRGDMGEAMRSLDAQLRGLDDTVPLHTNAFMDVRQTLLHLARNWDNGLDIAVMQDLDKAKCAVNLRVSITHKL